MSYKVSEIRDRKYEFNYDKEKEFDGVYKIAKKFVKREYSTFSTSLNNNNKSLINNIPKVTKFYNNKTFNPHSNKLIKSSCSIFILNFNLYSNFIDNKKIRNYSTLKSSLNNSNLFNITETKIEKDKSKLRLDFLNNGSIFVTNIKKIIDKIKNKDSVKEKIKTQIKLETLCLEHERNFIKELINSLDGKLDTSNPLTIRVVQD
jgi:hypothetical protein